MLVTGLVFLAWGWTALASPAARRSQTSSSIQAADFEPLRPAPSTDTVPLLLALPASDTAGLHAALMDVSDPASPKYGQYLSKQEVEGLVAPKPESVQVVTEWLSEHGITPEVASPSGDMLRVHIPVHQANALLSANYTQYVHKETNTTILATLAYSVPSEVEGHLSFIYPTDQFVPPAIGGPSYTVIQSTSLPKAVSTSADAPVPTQCAQFTTPQCLQAIYNIPSTPATAPSNNIYVPAFLNEFATQSDLQLFLNTLRPDISNSNFSIDTLDDGRTTGSGSFEASLDVQYTASLATGVNITLLSVGDGSLQGFYDAGRYFLALNDTPRVVTISYGFNEPGTPAEIGDMFCNQYAQLGARGTTVLYASGDGGVSGTRPNDTCTTFVPTFPSGCPYVTSVGATTGFSPETAAGLSSGGFSNIFGRPAYQQATVSAYLATLGDTYVGRFNTTGRGYPDIAAHGTAFFIVVNGQSVVVSGTSAASPTFASIVALINDHRLNAGKSSLGFLNPLLYSPAAARIFNDITNGSNPGCGTDGFPTELGWDPVTGLGTVDYQRFLNYALLLP